MTYLFDTNVCIAAMRGNAKVIQELAARSPEDCAVSMVSVFELFAGVFRCNDPAGEGQNFSGQVTHFNNLLVSSKYSPGHQFKISDKKYDADDLPRKYLHRISDSGMR